MRRTPGPGSMRKAWFNFLVTFDATIVQGVRCTWCFRNALLEFLSSSTIIFMTFAALVRNTMALIGVQKNAWHLQIFTGSFCSLFSLYYVTVLLIKDKSKGLEMCYSATYMSQQRFTISKVAADWHEPVAQWYRIALCDHRLLVPMDTGPAVQLADTPLLQTRFSLRSPQ